MSELEELVNTSDELRSLQRLLGVGFKGLYGIASLSKEELDILSRFDVSREYEVIKKILRFSEAYTMKSVWESITPDGRSDSTLPSKHWLEGFSVILALPIAAMAELKKRAAKEKQTKK